MIASLRRRHRWAALGLVVAAPLLLALGLSARRPEIRMDSLPAALADAAPEAPVLLDELPELWGETPIHTRRYGAGGGGVATVVELTPREPLRRPDLLIYWLPAGSAETFPERAELLGRLRGRHPQRFALPGPGGTLLLHSVAHGETLASAVLPDLAPGATR